MNTLKFKHLLKSSLSLFLAIVTILSYSSCTKSHPLFQSENTLNTTDSTFLQFFRPSEPLIKASDKITISIWGHEELSVGSVNGSFNSNVATGKWLVINKQGEANLPKLGRVKLAGLSINEANYYLQKEYGKILKDPIINVKVLNHFVTILGEVNKPGKYMIDNEQMTLIELIGLSNGLSSVKLQVNLRELAGIEKKNIVLQPDDIVYVVPTKMKDSSKNLQKASIVAGILTGVAVIFSVFSK